MGDMETDQDRMQSQQILKSINMMLEEEDKKEDQQEEEEVKGLNQNEKLIVSTDDKPEA